jgi:hypothetical protein
LDNIHYPTPFHYILSPPTATNPQTWPVLLSYSLICKRKKKNFLFKRVT